MFSTLLKFLKIAATSVGLLVILTSCGSPRTVGDVITDGALTRNDPSTRFIPEATTTWHAQLQGNITINPAVDLYIVDLFSATPTLTRDIRNRGARVICAFSGGSYKPSTPDSSRFSIDMFGGAVANTEKEIWLDHRIPAVRRNIDQRLELAKQSGCDGVAVSRLDGIHASHGINGLASADQFEYNRFLTERAHARRLSIGLFDSLAEAQRMAVFFDFALSRDCHAQNRCPRLSEFVRLGKAALVTESDQTHLRTATDKSRFCRNTLINGYNLVFAPKELDGTFRETCQTT